MRAEAYSTPERRKPLTGISLIGAEFLGFFQGAFCTLGILYATDTMSGGWGGATGGIDIQGMLITPTAVTVILASCALRTRYWTGLTAFFILGSWVLTFVLLIVLDDLFCPDAEEPVQACGISIVPVLSEVQYK
jgi:hypothetical protein